MAPTFKSIHYEEYPRVSTSLHGNQFNGKTVLIPGGGNGIGPFIARAYASAGVSEIILAGRNEKSLASTAAEIAASFPSTKTTYRVVDITKRESIDKLFNSLTRSPDILVNSAGYMPEVKTLEDVDLKEWWSGLEINVLGTAQLYQAFLRHRAAVDTTGQDPAVLVYLNSDGAYNLLFPGFSSYAVSKVAMARMVEVLSVEIPPSVARVVSVHPGSVPGPMHIKAGLGPGIQTTTGELAGQFIVWVTSKEAEWLSGRFAFANWDVDELMAKKDEVVEKNLLRLTLTGQF